MVDQPARIDLEDVDADVAIATIRTPRGTLDVVGRFRIVGRTLRVEDAHVQGLRPGALGRAGLNEIARAVLEIADVDELYVLGAVRTTGARPGARPAPFRYPHRRRAPGGPSSR